MAQGAQESKGRTLCLRAGTAHVEDDGKGVVRLPPCLMDELGARSGDILQITGRSTTAALLLAGAPVDGPEEAIGLDSILMENAGVTLSEPVKVRTCSAAKARRVLLGPADAGFRLLGDGLSMRRNLLHRPVVAGDLVAARAQPRPPRLNGAPGGPPGPRPPLTRVVRLRVLSTEPRGVVRIGVETEVSLVPEFTAPSPLPSDQTTYADVGGLEETIRQIREMVELPLKHPEIFRHLAVDPPRGVLLHGPPGTGKTLLARAVANESDASFFHIGGPEIMGRFYGESEGRLREVFSRARAAAPSIVFIDEIDSIAPKRADSRGEVERRVVAQLLTLMDGMESLENVVVMAATNRVEALDEALRRPGRFDREILTGPPDRDGRMSILRIHTRRMPLERGVDLAELADRTHGFVGADLLALAREAAMEALRRQLPAPLGSGPLPNLFSLQVAMIDFMEALRRLRPASLRELPDLTRGAAWSDVGGLAEARRRLKEGIELPLRHPEAFRRVGIRPPKGFLLFGPPGTGKTLLARAVAREAQANFIATRPSELLSKWYGDSEKKVAALFRRARQVAPAVIFLDELESLARRRGAASGEPAVVERVVNTLLAELDGLEALSGVVVMAATNQPALIDSALLRPGRLEEPVPVGLPDEDDRVRILAIHTRDMPLGQSVDLHGLARLTSGWSGADLEGLVRRAGLQALRDDLAVPVVTADHFQCVMDDLAPSVSGQMLQEHARAVARFQGGAVARRLGFSLHQPDR